MASFFRVKSRPGQFRKGAMTIYKSSPLERVLCLGFLCIASLVSSPLALSETNLSKISVEPDAAAIKLNGGEILRTFADVRDDAKVQDAAGTRAVNHWYSDGNFISRWSNGLDSGEVTGTWRIEKNMRCITITAGLPQRVGKERCGPVFRRGSEYLSFNSDGSIHGIHTLSPLTRPSK